MMDANIREALHKALDKFLDGLDTIDAIPDQLKRIEDRLFQLENGDKESFNLKEVSKITGFSYSYWHRRVEKNQIPCLQDGHGGKIVILRDDLVAYMKKHRIEPFVG